MIASIDHIVLTVRNINKSVDFYCNILGMKYEEFKLNKDSNLRKCLKFGKQKINLHEYDNLIIPGANIAKPGTADICFISEIDILEWRKIFITNSINIEFGPTDQLGADAKLRSIYVRDPDKNLIEIANKVY